MGAIRHFGYGERGGGSSTSNGWPRGWVDPRQVQPLEQLLEARVSSQDVETGIDGEEGQVPGVGAFHGLLQDVQRAVSFAEGVEVDGPVRRKLEVVPQTREVPLQDVPRRLQVSR